MMAHKNLTFIRRSCLTGRAVWIYRGPSEHAADESYRRACIREIERVRHFSDMAATRTRNISRLLNDCMDGIPFTAELTPQQREAAEQLHSLMSRGAYVSEFYEHIVEERRRRKQKIKNRNYDK